MADENLGQPETSPTTTETAGGSHTPAPAVPPAPEPAAAAATPAAEGKVAEGAAAPATAPEPKAPPPAEEIVHDPTRRLAVDLEDYERMRNEALSPAKATAPPPVEAETPGTPAPAAPETPPAATPEGAAAPAATPPAEEEETGKAPDRIRLGGLEDRDKRLIAMAKDLAANEKIGFGEAFARISGTNNPPAAAAPAATATAATTPPGAPAAGRTIEQINAEIAAAKGEKKTAADNLDTGKMFEADDKIDTLRDELAEAKDAQRRATAQAQNQFEQTAASSHRNACAFYPDAAKPESAFAKKMIEIADRMEAAGNPKVYEADSPLYIANLAANELGVAPIDPKNPPAPAAAPAVQESSKSTATRPPAVRQQAVVPPAQPAGAPASGSARTTTGAAKPAVDFSKLKTVDDYEKAKEDLHLSV